jgi:hypothetical protein
MLSDLLNQQGKKYFNLLSALFLISKTIPFVINGFYPIASMLTLLKNQLKYFV